MMTNTEKIIMIKLEIKPVGIKQLTAFTLEMPPSAAGQELVDAVQSKVIGVHLKLLCMGKTIDPHRSL